MMCIALFLPVAGTLYALLFLLIEVDEFSETKVMILPLLSLLVVAGSDEPIAKNISISGEISCLFNKGRILQTNEYLQVNTKGIISR